MLSAAIEDFRVCTVRARLDGAAPRANGFFSPHVCVCVPARV